MEMTLESSLVKKNSNVLKNMASMRTTKKRTGRHVVLQKTSRPSKRKRHQPMAMARLSLNVFRQAAKFYGLFRLRKTMPSITV